MSSDKITLSANKRDVLGKQVRGLRSSGQTPAVIHDHGKDSVHIAVEEREFKKVFSSAGKHHPVNLKVDGKNYTTLIKEVTFKPATNRVFHGVFQAIKANETVKAEIPVTLIGEEIPAEIAGLLVLKQLEHVEVEALPADLIDVLEVDATGLAEAGDKLTVADLKAPSGVEIKTDPEQTIATVEIPKDQVAEADAAAAELAEDAGTTEGEAEETEGETPETEESSSEDAKESSGAEGTDGKSAE
jgi:large subunit ribosomal protein L25